MFQRQEMQRTIAKAIEYSGIALHTGKEVNIRCFPAESNTGIVFRRVDLNDHPEIQVKPSTVVSTKRCTSIGLSNRSDCVVHTIEHLMAALWALGIDNLIIEIDNAETPVADGSALSYIKSLEKIGTVELKSARKIKEINQAIYHKKDDMYLVIMPYNGFKITYTLVYDHPVIGTQFFEYDNAIDDFIKEIAPARTFGFEREVEALHRRGLALGGSLENAVLIGEEKTINPLRFPDEFVRHKILDITGDMFLNGYIKGHIIAVRSGHHLHVELAKKIAASV
ncbi:UDP-3-O-acyl-N-acetylglucosamine deacetylase [Natronospora cellulosivora (SeqCode)]